MKKHYLISAVLLALMLGGSFISAQTDPFSQLTYPIPELGNCQSEEDCELFCETPENIDACIDYAEAHNLLPPEELEMARRMLGQAGPGGCQGMAECDAYCDDFDHMEECLNFAIEYEMMPPEEIAEAQKVLAAIQQGITPPPCQGKEACDIYCSEPAHMEVCLTFAVAAGLIPPEEAEQVEGMLRAIRQGVKSPDCYSDEECDIYCSLPENFEECITFAEAAGFMTPQEVKDSKRMLEAIRKGVAPPDCRSEEECDIYCSQPEHMVECVNFAEAAGFMSAEDAKQARKMAELGIVGGPGGCQSEEECQAFCQDPVNMEECIRFSVLIGEMTEEEAEQSLRGGPGGCRSEEECNAFCGDPVNMEECTIYSIEHGFISPEEGQQMLEQIRSGYTGEPGEPSECHTEECMGPEEFPPEGPPPEGPPPEEPPSEKPQKESEKGPTKGKPQSILYPITQFLASLISLFD